MRDLPDCVEYVYENTIELEKKINKLKINLTNELKQNANILKSILSMVFEPEPMFRKQ